MLGAAAAVEPDAEHGRVRRTGELLDAPEGREQHVRLAPYRTGERVATREGVVHGHVVEKTPDGSVRDERAELVLLESPATAEERELDHEVDTDDGAAELLDETGDRLHRPAGREHVVVDDDSRAASDRVGRDLERVLAVLERIGRGDGLRRELARPPRRDEAAAGLDRDRRRRARSRGPRRRARGPPRARFVQSASSPTACRSASGSAAAARCP